MLLSTYAIHNDIIWVNTTEFFKPCQRIINKVLKDSRCIGQPKAHDLKLKQVKFTTKSKHVLVGWLNLNLMIAGFLIQTRKDRAN